MNFDTMMENARKVLSDKVELVAHVHTTGIARVSLASLTRFDFTTTTLASLDAPHVADTAIILSDMDRYITYGKNDIVEVPGWIMCKFGIHSHIAAQMDKHSLLNVVSEMLDAHIVELDVKCRSDILPTDDSTLILIGFCNLAEHTTVPIVHPKPVRLTHAA